MAQDGKRDGAVKPGGVARKNRSRGHGHGTLEKTRSGVYVARWMMNGKRYSRSTGCRDIREAQKVLEVFTAPFRLESEQKTLENIATRIEGKEAEIRRFEERQPALSLDMAFERFRKSGLAPDCSERTWSGYEAHFRRLMTWVKKNRPEINEMRAFTQEDASAFAADMKEHSAAGTYNKHIVFFRSLWKTLTEEEDGMAISAERIGTLPRAKLTCNPWVKIKKREVMEHTRRELTVEELARVCQEVTGEMRILFAVGIYTGLRLGDCALLEWGSVDLIRGRIAVIPRKTKRHAHGKQTVIPIHPVLAEMLSETAPERREGYVMPDTANQYIKNDSLLSRYIQRVFAKSGIRTHTVEDGNRSQVDVGFHSLRHTFVSLSANAGAPLAIVQAIVGHSNPAMTRHYYHESDSALRSAVSSLPDVTLDLTSRVTQMPGDKTDTPLAEFKKAVDALPDCDFAEAIRYISARCKTV